MGIEGGYRNSMGIEGGYRNSMGIGYSPRKKTYKGGD